MKIFFVKSIQDKDNVSSPFLVKYCATPTGKNGKPYINLILADRTGDIEARIWDGTLDEASKIQKGCYLLIEGKAQLYQGRKQLVVHKFKMLADQEVNAQDYIAETLINPTELYAQLLEYVASMEDPYYRALAESILKDDAEIVALVKEAPAAKSVHHAYKGGLIEHVVSITGILDSLSKHYGKYLDRDLLFLGGFLHDIGKIWELSYDKVTDYTTEGKLIGHLVMGVELIERKIQELEAQTGRLPGPFPVNKKLLVKHVILAHHGELEYGSPKRPKCLEALVVHYIDDLDSKINVIRTFIESDKTPGEWTALHKMYQRFFFKPEWARDV